MLNLNCSGIPFGVFDGLGIPNDADVMPRQRPYEVAGQEAIFGIYGFYTGR